MGEPKAIGLAAAGSAVPGEDEVNELLLAGLSVRDAAGVQRPRLAQMLPSTENGLWTVFPDGRMETTWKLRPDARWHDGTLFTADDLVFTTRVMQDRELGLASGAFAAIESVEARDAHTAIVRWTRLYLKADTLFGAPLPKHVLEHSYAGQESFLTLILHFLTDQLIVMGLFYDVEVTLAAERVKNVTARNSGAAGSWNAERWDVAS